MQASQGSYIRTVEKLPKDAVIAVFHPIGFDRSTITFLSAFSIKSSTGDSYLLTPSTAYKVYGMADGGDTVRDYNLTITTDAAYTTLKAADSVMDSSMWGLNASQNITLSVAESPFIVPGGFVNLNSVTYVYKIIEINRKASLLTYAAIGNSISFGAGTPASLFNQIIPSTYTEAAFASDHTMSAYLLFKSNSINNPAKFRLVDTELSSGVDTIVNSIFQVVIEQ